ncbi:putative pyruvate dehydrogenase E1 component subunit alpha-3, chloroplastic-like [Capsicum annuum]|nr:putative pyruvate dehydrogenase E1 component subunit alpha-3, chloroplastic-like [Capsicum annuum]
MERGRGRWVSSVSRGMLPLLGMHTMIEYSRLERKPPVTAALLAANTIIYLRPTFLHPILPTINQVSRQYAITFGEGDSVGDINGKFATFVAISQGVKILLAKSLLLLFDYERPCYQEYSVGFSGVLFAMKVILNAQSDDYTDVHGLLVPTHYAAWAELILIQMFVPGVSFLGHIGGILAGLLFLRLKASYSGANPLRTIVRGFSHALNWPLRFVKWVLGSQPRIGGRGTVGRTDDGPSLSSFSSVDEVQDLSLDELRRRRIQRFGR